MNSPVIPSSSRTSSPSSSSSSFWSIRLSSTSSHPPRLYSLSICCRRCYWRGGGVVALDDPPPSPPPPSSRGEGRGGDSNRRSPSQIQVPRQSYIPVSKTDLLDALVFTFNSRRPLDGDDDCNSLVRQFLILSSCLESILHAEHKAILEEMRTDYSLCCPNRRRSGGDGGEPLETFGASNSNDNGSVGSYAEDDPIGTGNQMDFHYRASTAGNWRNSSDGSSTSRVEIATRFQRSFMKLLSDAQFEELSVRDLLLTSALNGDYLLTLPIYVDWKKASESNAVIFRRGYVTEKQKGRLIVEKLDYLQSKLLQGAFSIISKPLRMVGLWISKTLESGEGKSKIQVWLKRIKLWIEETSQALPSYGIQASKMMDDIDNKFGGELPIWLTAQRAVSRYEGLLSSVGPRGRLLRRFLTWTGLIQSSPERSLELSDDIDALEPYLRPVSISRIALADIWRPATSEYCGNDIWRILRNSISIIFSQSVLQEPAFDQLILLYTAGTSKDEARDNIEVPTLQLRIYEKIPIPDLPVIFPNKKLSFRILDTVCKDQKFDYAIRLSCCCN